MSRLSLLYASQISPKYSARANLPALLLGSIFQVIGDTLSQKLRIPK